MTSEHATDFASELVKMAQAMTRLPQVEQQVRELSADLDQATNTIQRLELKLLDRAGEIDNLHALLRAEEAKRSDAETMFLECDDAKSTLARTLAAIIQEAQGVLKAIAPPEPQAAQETKPDMTLGSEQKLAVNAVLEPSDTFQGVKSNHVAVEWPLADGSLSPFVPAADTTPSTDASSSEGTAEGESASPFANGEHTSPNTVESEPVTLPESVASIDGVSVPSDPTQESSVSSPKDDHSDDSVLKIVTPSADASSAKPDYYDYDDTFGFGRQSHHS